MSTLAPSRKVYVEYSNEVWNGQFKQYKQNDAAAKAEVAAGENTLNDGGRDTNVHYWARKRVAKRSVEMKKLLGDDPRIRVVLASQIGFAPPEDSGLAAALLMWAMTRFAWPSHLDQDPPR